MITESIINKDTVIDLTNTMLVIEAPGDKHKGKITRVRVSNKPLGSLANLTVRKATEEI